MPFKAILFDLDGTLVSSSPEHRQILLGQIFQDLGIEKTQDELQKLMPSINRFWFENPRSKIIKEQFGVEEKTFWQSYVKFDTPELRLKFTKPFPDVSIIK